VNFVLTFPPLVRALEVGRLASRPSPGASLSPPLLLGGVKGFEGGIGGCAGGGEDMICECRRKIS
jgi:hypothetical protein